MVIHAEEKPRAEERLSHLEGAYDHLATKADVADLRTEMQAGFAEGRAETADLRTEVRTGFAEAEARSNRQIAELRKENAEAEARTNQQIAELRTEMQTGFAEVRTETAEMRTGFAEVRTENAENQTRLIRWAIAIGALVAAAVTLLDRLLG